MQLFIILMYTYQLYWLHSAHPSNFILGICSSQVRSGNIWSTCPILLPTYSMATFSQFFRLQSGNRWIFTRALSLWWGLRTRLGHIYTLASVLHASMHSDRSRVRVGHPELHVIIMLCQEDDSMLKDVAPGLKCCIVAPGLTALQPLA